MYVRFKEKEGIDMVPCAELPSITLVLEDNHYRSAELPKTPTDWIKKEPFFIKLTPQNSGFFWWCLQIVGICAPRSPYIAMAESSKEGPKYKIVSLEEVDKVNPSLMLFTMNYQPVQRGNMQLSTATPRSVAEKEYWQLSTAKPTRSVAEKGYRTRSVGHMLLGDDYSFPSTVKASEMIKFRHTYHT